MKSPALKVGVALLLASGSSCGVDDRSLLNGPHDASFEAGAGGRGGGLTTGGTAGTQVQDGSLPAEGSQSVDAQGPDTSGDQQAPVPDAAALDGCVVNACGGCGTLAAAPGAACGKCGKCVCGADRNSLSCSDVTCGTCQVCSVPLSCSTLPLNSVGQCSSTQYCNGSSTSCVACPVPATTSELHYVDPMYGTDDANHGGAYGHCGYKTLTYALAHATGQIALRTATYSPQSGETFPIVLRGQQALLCNFSNASPATIQGKGKYDKILIDVSVAFEGTQNSLYNCVIDGGGGNGYCLDVFSSGSTFPQTHIVTGANIGNCGGTAVLVENGRNNLSIQSSTLHNSLVGVFWAGSNAGASMQNNSFSANTTDIQCSGTDTGVTGSGNHGATGGSPICTRCGNCPF